MTPLVDVPLIAGALLGWSLAAPPGPGNALIAQEAARRGWPAGLATGAGAITADVLMFLLMWLGVLRILAYAPWLIVVLGVFGSVLMAWFALDAYRKARAPAAADPHARGGFWRTFLTIVSSPFNHVWWLTSGTVIFANMGGGLIVGFFGSLVLWIAIWSGLAVLGAARIRRFTVIVGYGSAVVLAAFAVLAAVFTVQQGLALAGLA